MPKPVITTNKSPAVAVQSIVLLQVILGVTIFISSFFFSHIDIANNLRLAESFSNELFLGIFYTLVEVISITLIFVNWNSEVVKIRKDRIIDTRGLIFKRSSSIDLKSAKSINFRNGRLGRMFNFGDIIIVTEDEEFIIENISDPTGFIGNIMSICEYSFETNAIVDGDEFDEQDLLTDIKKGEGERLEFKSTFAWDMRLGKVNKDLQNVIMKSICGFLNSEGGRLVIGVEDGGEPLGLELDYKSLRKSDADGFENKFTQVFNKSIGAEFRRLVNLEFVKVGRKEVCVVNISKSNKPIYMRDGEAEQFYIRTGNSTTPLKLSEIASYVSERWG